MTTNKKVAAGSSNKAYRDQKIAICKEIVQRVIAQYEELNKFLGKVTNIDSIMISLFSKESSINEGLYISPWSQSYINKHVSKGSAKRFHDRIIGSRPLSFVYETVLPHGVGQVMGWHMISDWRDGYAYIPGTKDHVFSVIKKKDGSSFLVDSNANPESINNNFRGPDALENGIRASLGILLSKFENRSGIHYNIRTAVASYLGSAGAKDIFGTTPEAYASAIIDGHRLSVAQPTSTSNIQVAKNSATTGPATDSKKAETSKWSCTA